MANVSRLVFDASQSNRYATFFYAQFEPAKRKLAYTNGGHNPPVVLRGADAMPLEVGGPPVGLFRETRYEQAEMQLEPGDLLIFFTDGFSEAENAANDEWGEDALISTVRACGGVLPADDFAAGAPQHDDMTLSVARVLSKARSRAAAGINRAAFRSWRFAGPCAPDQVRATRSERLADDSKNTKGEAFKTLPLINLYNRGYAFRQGVLWKSQGYLRLLHSR